MKQLGRDGVRCTPRPSEPCPAPAQRIYGVLSIRQCCQVQDGDGMDFITKGLHTGTGNNPLSGQKGRHRRRLPKQRIESCLQFSITLCSQWAPNSDTSESPGELLKNIPGPCPRYINQNPRACGLGSFAFMSAPGYPAEVCLMPVLHII